MSIESLRGSGKSGKRDPVRMVGRIVGAIVLARLIAGAPALAAPLPTAASWTAEINSVGAWFGRSVSTAGDVNGDGYSDVIVGAFEYTNDQPTEGAVFVYLGSASGPSMSPDWIVEGNQGGANCGESVAAAGDVNGDGYDDVIVGVPGWTTVSGREGQVRLYLGSAGGLGSTPAWTANGSSPQHRFGASVAGAGDVNGDGLADILVGDPTTGGIAHVYFGSAQALSSTPDWAGVCDQPAAYYGIVAGAGDVNGDGFGDIAVGAYRYENGQAAEGMAFVYHGGPSGPAVAPSWTAESNQDVAEFGFAVAPAGDVNGDGFGDLLVGAPAYGATNAGRSYLYRGSAIGLEAAATWIIDGAQAGERFGYAVATAGDVNADGFADVVVGGLDYDNPLMSEGRAVLHLGSPAGLSAQAAWSGEGNQSGAFFGVSVATAGDVNGDGMSDVVVGAFRHDNGEFDEGRATVYLGATAPPSLTANWSADSNQANAYLGSSLAAAGDVNGDGFSDVIAGAPNYDSGDVDEGRAFLYLGTASGPSPSASWAADGEQGGAHFGAAVSGAGDVNGDGYEDVIVGAPDFDGQGRVAVFLGSAGGLSTTPASTLDGDQAGAQFGAAVACAGDVNGDGFGDVIVGQPLYDNGESNEGRALVFLGSAAGLSGSAAWTGEGNVPGAEFGRVVSSAGDVNGDGRSDVLVGAPSWYDFLIEGGEGAAFVFHGTESGVESAATWFTDGDAAGIHFGISASHAGDVNGDGWSDIVVGASGFNDGEGVAFVFCGSALGLPTTPSWTMSSGVAYSAFGRSVAGAGDVNGDGWSDVIIGAPWYWTVSAQTNEGAAFIYLGSPSGLASSHVWAIEGNAYARELGQLVVRAGDVNGDGLADVAYGIQVDSNGQVNEGRVFVHLGNERDGLDLRIRQRRADDGDPIAILGRSESSSSFRIAALARTAAGRQKLGLEWEVKPLGTPFDGTGRVRSPLVDSGLPGGSGSALSMSELVAGLDANQAYAYRVRVVGASPLFPHSLWLSPPGNGRAETDVRTGDAPVGVAEAGMPRPGSLLVLRPSAPNPFNPRTTLSYAVVRDGRVDVRVFDARGRLVAVPVSGFAEAGEHRVAWEARREDGTVLPSGVYIVQVSAGGEVASQKITLIR